MQRESEWDITRRELDKEAEKPPEMHDSWKKDAWYSVMFEAFLGTVGLILRFIRGIFSAI
ncbi:hypothetical protein [Salinicoccus halodurans]|uniref:Uncharacterized protein n=1 Tax=Salinicoccus halodurans TaxID=407035 RepID=A0A0F7HP23_9STAP|nr:hypothetical protein [Salinicoccus halodurans]AKG74876.1 hypothetical protein AAT16_12165 [Salinicoccus halodurans]SFK69054.1 hypothetical protein SAMN05216235_1200 [Salinicoccus halodurans]